MKKLEKDINYLNEKVAGSLFKTNPIKNNIKNKLFESADKFKDKAEYTSNLVDSFYLMKEEELYLLFSSEDELIRNIAVRAYVDKNQPDLLFNFKKMLKDKNELIRHSAVVGLAYLNLRENLGLLKKALTDKSDVVKLAALTGIANIAQEYNCDEAKNVLKTFLNYPNEQIREFIEDELSLLF